MAPTGPASDLSCIACRPPVSELHRACMPVRLYAWEACAYTTCGPHGWLPQDDGSAACVRVENALDAADLPSALEVKQVRAMGYIMTLTP